MVFLYFGCVYRVFDIGCGLGNFIELLFGYLLDGGFVVGFDIFVLMLISIVLDNCGLWMCYICGYVCMVLFGDEIFDVVCCFGVL